MSFGLHADLSKEWNSTIRSFHEVALTFPVRAAVFYAAMAEEGKKAVQDELMARVYSKPLPQGSSWGAPPSPRTGRTLLNVKASWSALASRVFVDRRGFPAYFYPWILEHGRKVSPAYYPRRFFEAAMRRMEVVYFREARFLVKNVMRDFGRI